MQNGYYCLRTCTAEKDLGFVASQNMSYQYNMLQKNEHHAGMY